MISKIHFDTIRTINNRKTDVSEALDKLKNGSYKATLVGAIVTCNTGLFRGTIYNMGLADSDRERWRLLLCHWSNLFRRVQTHGGHNVK